jgi:2Fe-2S ferredoxin
MRPALEQIASEPTQKEIVLLVVDHHGREHALPALEGWRVMEVIRDWGISLKAICGGACACACASCHVYVDEPWVERLQPPTAEEEDRLDEALAVEPSSRLSCQILMSQGISAFRWAGAGSSGVSAMDRLDELEAQSIFIFREAFARMKKLALLWSLGKDST